MTVSKKLKGDPLGFSNIHFDAKQQKMKGRPFGEKIFRKKSLAVPKNIERGDPLVSPVLYDTRKKRENFFDSVPWVNRYNFVVP